MELHITKNYSIFVHNDEQRTLDEKHVNKIGRSIIDNGFLPSKPIQVYKKGDKLIVVDGHHRLEAAKKLECGVYYVIENKSCQKVMAVENSLVKKWALIDYARLYASRGMVDYVVLLKYYKIGIPLSMAASMMVNQEAASGNASEAIKDGTFTIKTMSQVDVIKWFIENYSKINPVCKTRTFISALSKCVKYENFDIEHFKKKLNNQIYSLQKTQTAEQMLDQIEHIYNFASQNKIPIKIPAIQASKLRSFVNKL